MSSDADTAAYLLNIGTLLYETFGLFIIVVSTIGNICNCFVFLCIRSLNKHPNALFVIGSSIGSLLFINIGLFSSIISVFSGFNPSNRWLFWCKISTWLYYSAGCCSFMCICFSAFGQCLLTLPKIKWQRLITRIRAQLMILFTAIIWLIIFLPLSIFSNQIQISATTSTCTVTVPIISVYAAYWVIIGYYFLPIILLLILFCLTWYNLKQLLRRRRNLESAMTRMMLIQMSVILISGIPASICIIYSLATKYSTKTYLRLVYESVIFLAFVLFTFFTNGISFWIYLFVSKTFRKHIKDFISKSKLFKNRLAPLSTLTTKINVPH
ncbi:unnamed protein product [Rotaria sordida]|uniref:G-protein coupled receptors family 1 profile domain-containing protein n=1 Tax=Rotaria sordida TaxID=392033 RepID=A0A815CHR6_9BILA|nr:unnamed protein product [Rotaria sordida]CAF1280491.1 unnamed protein product [Rotaria sordida]CAF1287631.1 unnamed protein product [Rotaria sordida]CAF1376410.1 unnamed protein product [Rotaria sordida]CAF1614080.1 unnamed protein product [Rotaria sordida]